MYVASINLRIDVPVDGNNQWSYRKDKMIEFINRENFDVIGMQEAGPNMFQDLQRGLSDTYHLIYQARDHRGEGTPIAIRKDLSINTYGTRWLTDTPTIESTIAGSYFPRIVTYVRVGGQTPFYVFNTHLDYSSDVVCTKQSEYLLKIIDEVNQEHLPYLITGDFNQHPDSMTIRFLRESHQSIYDHVKEYPLTFHGFNDEAKGLTIDYVFFTHHWNLQSYKIHQDKKDNLSLSDHYPISVHIMKK